MFRLMVKHLMDTKYMEHRILMVLTMAFLISFAIIANDGCSFSKSFKNMAISLQI